jgi:alkanesulfonate monooxygenase SsuD/methylene tetrahydromethanopterin reductase-like flavin-dependent oxidoreductase (luciferase family)
MKSINWGVYLREPSWDVDKIQEFIKHAENLGFHGIYTNDHLTGFDKSLGGKESYLEAWTFITAILSWSTRLRAGHTVLCQSFRNPALLAKMVSSLDILSGGRFDLFLGAGWKEDEYQAYSYPFPSPGTRLRQLNETVTILRNLFNSNIEEWNFEGEFWTLQKNRNFPKPKTQPFPIHLGGSKPKFIQMAAKIADGFNTGGGSFDESIRKFLKFDEEVEKLGEDPSKRVKSFFGGLRIFRTEKDTLEYAKELIQKNKHFNDKKPNEVVKNQPWGTPEVIAEKIRTLAEIGVNFIILNYQCNYSEDPLTIFWDEIRPLI